MSEEEQFEPIVVAFCCNWCSYAGADLAGTSRLQYPPNIRIVRVMCSGMVHPNHIMDALTKGADGVYTWNLGTPFEFRTGRELDEIRNRYYACLSEIGEAGMLVGKSKLFCVDNGEGEVMPYYAHISSRWPLPIPSKHGVLSTGVIGRVPLVVGDDLEARRPDRATLMVSIDDVGWKDALVFRLNGDELVGGEFVPGADDDGGGRLDFAVTAPPLKTGSNFVEVAAKQVAIPDNPVKVTAIKLRVEYAQ